MGSSWTGLKWDRTSVRMGVSGRHRLEEVRQQPRQEERELRGHPPSDFAVWALLRSAGAATWPLHDVRQDTWRTRVRGALRASGAHLYACVNKHCPELSRSADLIAISIATRCSGRFACSAAQQECICTIGRAHVRAGEVVGEGEVAQHTTPRTSSNVAHNKSICRSGPAAAHANAMVRAACCMLHVVRRTLRDTCCVLQVVCYAVCACTDYLNHGPH